MERNEGKTDRALRIVAGIVLVLLAAGGALGPWAWLGLVPLLTGLFGFCPLYRVFGWNTCSHRDSSQRGVRRD